MSKRSYSKLFYHFIWSTKNRKQLIDSIWEHRLYGYIFSKCRMQEMIPIVIGGTCDHIHILLRAVPEISPAVIAGNLKGASSHFVNSVIDNLKQFRWQKGYGVFSVSYYNINTIINSIKNQKIHHKQGTINTELENINMEDDELSYPEDEIDYSQNIIE